MPLIDETLAAEIEKITDPGALIATLVRRFVDRAAIGTSGQLTGVVMIDMAVKAGVKPRIFTIDTLRLFPETYQLFDAIEKKYGIKVERIQPEPKNLESMVRENGEFLFFDSKAKQELCCRIRKVDPNEKVLDTLDVWITGLRVDQSASRAQTKRCEIIFHGSGNGKDKRPILKVAPLVSWTEEELRAYIKKNDVPVHKLLNYEKNGWYYESLGCVICTTPIGPDEPRRAGRWRWFNAIDSDKECGLHKVTIDEA